MSTPGAASKKLHGASTSAHHGSLGRRFAPLKKRFLSGRHSITVCNIPRMIRKRRGRPSRLREALGFALALGAAVAITGGRSAQAADVKGRIVGWEHLRNPVWVAARDPGKHGYSFREPVTTVPAGMRKLFPQISKEICIVALAAAGGAGAGKPVSVRVSGGRTTPTTLVVTPGTELRFKNADPFDHRLYGVGFTTLAASTTAKGALRRWTPQDAGRYEIRDELSPSLLMWVVAEPAVAATAFPAFDGRFVVALEQPGQYMLQAYFAGEAVGRPLPVAIDKRDVDVSGKPLVLATKPPVEDNTP